MMTWKKIIFWFLAVVITLSAAVYQRLSGPTYPVKFEIEHQDSLITFHLPRSHGGETDCPVELKLPSEYSGSIIFRRFPTNEPWDTVALTRKSDTLLAMLPNQPPAGKLEYHVELFRQGDRIDLHEEENIVVRFKGEVPAWALIPHVFLMFFAMLWSNATGLLAAAKVPSYKRNALITLILFFTGGMILGPVVQKYAFGAYWTGWPLGEDLTDNKVLFSVILWILAVFLNRKKERRWLVITAAVVLLIIYMIPHSMHGSELDYTSGEIISNGLILPAMLMTGRKQKNSVDTDEK